MVTVRRLMVMSRIAVLVTVLTVATAACGGSARPVADGPLPTAEELIEQYGVTPAALEDLRWIAGEEGWTLEEAIYRVAWQEGFSLFANEIRGTYPDEFAGAGILGDEGPHNVFISFRSAVPDAVRDDPRLEHLDVDFREMTGFSEDQLGEQTIAIHRAMLDAGFVDVVTGPDIDTGMIEVQAERRTFDHGRSDPQILAVLPDIVRAGNVRVVFFDFVPDGGED
jgi:hypothetical protein